MKAISIRQPWAWLVLYAGKSVENRNWTTSFRGEFLIHSSKGMTRDEYEDGVDSAAMELGLSFETMERMVPDFESLVRGGIIGRARLVDVVPPCAFPGSQRCTCGRAWHIGVQNGFVLEDVHPLPFIPYRGALGLFDVPDEIVARAIAGGTR